MKSVCRPERALATFSSDDKHAQEAAAARGLKAAQDKDRNLVQHLKLVNHIH